jgi:hypothetical protein
MKSKYNECLIYTNKSILISSLSPFSMDRLVASILEIPELKLISVALNTCNLPMCSTAGSSTKDLAETKEGTGYCHAKC